MKEELAQTWSSAVRALAAGKPVVVTDEARQHSDLVLAGAHATADGVNFLAKHAGGLLALALPPERVERLRLRPMAVGWGEPARPFTVSIEAKGVSTGISAPERARTVRVACAADAQPDELISPGHVFPVRARPGARGRVEAALELAAPAGSPQGAVLMEILDDEGAIADDGFVRALAQRFALPRLTIEQIEKGASQPWR